MLDSGGGRGLRDDSQTGECRTLIREALEDRQPHPCDPIIADLQKLGYSKRTIQHASSGLRVKRAKKGFGGGWYLATAVATAVEFGVRGHEFPEGALFQLPPSG